MSPSAEQVAAWAPALGAVAENGGARFTVWAPDAQRVEVLLEHADGTGAHALERLADGSFAGWQAGVAAGARYRLRLDGGRCLPDPASRWQPDGVHGASAFVDPSAFVWSDTNWRGVPRDELVIYELHVGAFSPQGTFAGVEARLGDLAALGVTAIELMPIAECAGAHNWGYDGVDLFAPSHHYGTPDDLRRLINAAHRHGLAVLLDVVYNHLGPDGAYLSAYSGQYFSRTEKGPWGDAVNLYETGCEHVRAFFVENALHWIHEYHIDGLRLDATHALVDRNRPHFLAEFAARVRAAAGRAVLLIAEDERNLATLAHQPPHGFGFDAVWSDDFHHQMRVALTGEREGYFGDFAGTAADIAATIRQGWFYRGQPAPRSGQPRGSDPSGLAPSQFVVCLQNHDQIGNRACGDRLHHAVDLAAYRAVSALLLLLPQVPLLFMGQEWAASTPFLYFTDHAPGLGPAITAGRRQEFSAFAAFSDPQARAQIPDPQDPSTFARSRLHWAERGDPPHAGVERLYRALLRLRRDEPAFRGQNQTAAVSAPDDDTVVVRRGPFVAVARLRREGVVALPLTAHHVLLSSEDDEFASSGAAPHFDHATGRLHFSGPATVLLRR